MIKLYHAIMSVCSVKARLVLAEKGLHWESELVDLQIGDQHTPQYRMLNPDGVVPTLVHDGFVLRESTAILEYVDLLGPKTTLIPADIQARANMTMWLVRTIEIHAGISAMTIATLFRPRDLASSSPEEIEAKLAKLANPQLAEKRRDIYRNGMRSIYIDGAIHTLNAMLTDMERALSRNQWLCGPDYSLSDVALTAYVDRLDMLGMAGFWTGRFEGIDDWLTRCRARPSYSESVTSYISGNTIASMEAAGRGSWPEIASRL